MCGETFPGADVLPIPCARGEHPDNVACVANGRTADGLRWHLTWWRPDAQGERGVDDVMPVDLPDHPAT